MTTPQADIQFIRMLSERLERISADSVWAHRASGIRGELLRILDEEPAATPADHKVDLNVVSLATHILSQAAKRL